MYKEQIEDQVKQTIAAGQQVGMLELLRDVLSGKTRMSASNYIELVAAINKV